MRMRITSWYVTLGIVGASAIGVVACTSTTTVNNTGDDASTDDGATSAEPDTGTPDTGTPATDGPATVVPTDGGDGGIVCDTTGVTDTCDLCALQSCCDAENQCQNVEATGDAGTTECQDIFSCVQDCIVPPADSGVDAGDLSDCTTLCATGHGAQSMTDFTALSTCLATSCTTQCM